jgi:hypothetical protein
VPGNPLNLPSDVHLISARDVLFRRLVSNLWVEELKEFVDFW